MYFIALGLLASLFLLPSKSILNSSQVDRDQTFTLAIKEAFSHKRLYFISFRFFCLRFPNYISRNPYTGYMQERGMGGWSATVILALIGFLIFSELLEWVT